MRLTWLVAVNPTCKSDLAELSIEQAIKSLSPPKPPKETPLCGQPPEPSKPNRPTFTGTDIIAAWIGSLASERTRALNAMGLNQVLEAMPREWWPIIESSIAPRNPPQATTASDAVLGDLEIPTFLRRELLAAPLNTKLDATPKHDCKIDDPGATYPIAARS